MWGVLGLLNWISYIFITIHRHLKLKLGMMAKRAKLLAIYDAIPPMQPSKISEQIMGTVIRLNLLSFYFFISSSTKY